MARQFAAPRAHGQLEELLSNPERTVKEIAMQCGFVDSAHFCKAFKAESGLTPKSYRESCRDGDLAG